MMKTRSILALAVAGLLAACAEKPSLTDSDMPATSDYEVVAFCYSSKTTTREELASMAMEACPEETRRVSVLDDDTLFNNCPISKKNRVTYQCLPR
ncbi:hypothetical protein HH303_06965 [Rhodospirillaceae bacterium KN72]|uniref:Lipoprotein n=1 Tax=Pacificispira spongiicola TaxID=2729598 RepID=A0A7Y0HDV1_9PROT|nr:hypothetical protein [Pacificispira spongiicola]NMM44211.1 hypothetical protein [Pacificispira spongiicola]